MELIDRYLTEVGKHLPRKSRLDIQRELRSTLEDMLADRSRESGQPVDDAMTIALLKEYGSPEKVAASYAPARYLVGPQLYSLFTMVTKIVLAVVFCSMLFVLVVSLYRTGLSGRDFLSELGKFGLNFWNGAIIAFGYIVLAFAIIERSMSPRKIAAELDEEKGVWDPGELAREPYPDQVKPVESIVAILFILLGLVLLNFYPEAVGAWFLINGEWTHIPMLSAAFFSYLPWINLLFLLEIGLHLVLLRRGRWETGTRLANIALNLAGIGLALAMLTGPALVEFNPAAFAGTPLADVIPTLSWVFGWLPTIVLIVLIVVQSIEVVQDAARLIKGKVAAPEF